MSSIKIPYRKINFLSPLVQDYLSESTELSSFYGRYNTIDSFRNQMEEKSQFPIDRMNLVDVLKKQNQAIDLSDLTQSNIESLESKDTFTITTGHQLCIFTGPLYFLYKIVSTINLSLALKEKYPSKHFVPVFWLASEDHDFDEINHIHLFGQTIRWDSSQGGAVGRMNLSDFSSVLDELNAVLGDSKNAEYLKTIFHKAYSSANLAQATRVLINELFKDDGLVIIDGDDVHLKKSFVDIMKKDIQDHSFYPLIASQSEKLSENYKAQAYVRECNFFQLEQGSRNRVLDRLDAKEIDSNPEKFSPNVLLRPLYQEMILPNLAYIGGGAELSYWMQLKTAFKSEHIPFPILVLRNSVILTTPSQIDKINHLGFSFEDFFGSESDLHKKYVQNKANISLESQVESLGEMFHSIKDKFNDKAYESMIDAEHQRQKKSLENLSKKLHKVEKQKHEVALSQISKIKTSFFPNRILQERYNNFIPYYLKYGDNFIKKLKEELNPLDTNFVVLPL
ncbi:MAG: bacillithiol biosynthesis cysteine-adding enzyme BshC [Flavobacteriales bacterium]